MNPALLTPTSAAPAPAAGAWLQMPSHWPAQGDLLSWSQNMAPGTAAVLVLAGLIYLVFGFFVFRALVTLNAALLGGYIGAWVGRKGGPSGGGRLSRGLGAAGGGWQVR